jgi:hypothetical protein
VIKTLDGGYLQAQTTFYGIGVNMQKFTSTGATDTTFGSAGALTINPPCIRGCFVFSRT